MSARPSGDNQLQKMNLQFDGEMDEMLVKCQKLIVKGYQVEDELRAAVENQMDEDQIKDRICQELRQEAKRSGLDLDKLFQFLDHKTLLKEIRNHEIIRAQLLQTLKSWKPTLEIYKRQLEAWTVQIKNGMEKQQELGFSQSSPLGMSLFLAKNEVIVNMEHLDWMIGQMEGGNWVSTEELQKFGAFIDQLPGQKSPEGPSGP